ncbi:MAG: hypothetical protein M3069_06320 [Chloroflexota bacterium]|nr:hypothetical protein [Chloroflexota bacterium]
MRTGRELASLVIEQAFQMLADNVRGLRIDEALFVPPGGYRSTLGTLKHMAGWSHVYRSYAFDAEPRHWAHIDWPRGLRDTVEPSQSYLDEVIAWTQAAHTSWLRCLDELPDMSPSRRRSAASRATPADEPRAIRCSCAPVTILTRSRPLPRRRSSTPRH